MVKNIRKVFRSYRGRHFLSRWARKIFDRSSAQAILGLGLILAVFSLTILTPQALAFVETAEINTIPSNEKIPVSTTTELTFRYPLENFNISQEFSWHHWGIDLTAPEETPAYSIARGKVIEVATALLGYGNYVLIDHENGQRSLYAHLAKQLVKTGDQVTKDTVIGLVGHTGWATGDHLHLEIYSGGLPLNPLEVLPSK